MEDLINIIDNISIYGLKSDVETENKEKDLERYLVLLYSKFFQIDYKYDVTDYSDFDKKSYPDVRENVRKNFPDFGFYHVVLNSCEVLNVAEVATGDAIDDLSDIIYDLLEIKWRFEKNSKQDGLWYFELIFYGHTQQHLIDLLNFMKAKNG